MANVLVVKQGTTPTIQFTFTNASTGAPLDITGYTLLFTVKKNVTDADSAALIKKTWNPVSGGGLSTTNGQTQLSLTSTDTNISVSNYYYDVRLIDTGGGIQNVDKSVFTIELPITIRTS